MAIVSSSSAGAASAAAGGAKLRRVDLDIVVEFVELYEMTEMEKAQMRKTDADTGAVLIEAGVVSPEEERQRVAEDPDTPYVDLDAAARPPPPQQEEGERKPDDPLVRLLSDARKVMFHRAATFVDKILKGRSPARSRSSNWRFAASPPLAPPSALSRVSAIASFIAGLAVYKRAMEKRLEPSPARRQLALAAICAAVIALAPPIAKAQPAIRLATGESRTVTFAENPSTGYSWAIDPTASRNLEALSITDLGYLPGSETMPGAPGKHSWRIGGVSPGQAEIVFVYQRPWKRLRSEPRGLR